MLSLASYGEIWAGNEETSTMVYDQLMSIYSLMTSTNRNFWHVKPYQNNCISREMSTRGSNFNEA